MSTKEYDETGLRGEYDRDAAATAAHDRRLVDVTDDLDRLAKQTPTEPVGFYRFPISADTDETVNLPVSVDFTTEYGLKSVGGQDRLVVTKRGWSFWLDEEPDEVPPTEWSRLPEPVYVELDAEEALASGEEVSFPHSGVDDFTDIFNNR